MRSVFFCVLACVFAACWEFSAAETTLGTSARQLAIDARLYHARHPFQIAGTIAILAAAAAVLIWIFEQPHLEDGMRLLWLAFNLFAALSLVVFLSLNSIDLLANTLVLTFPVIQWLKLACAAIAHAASAASLPVR